jgi:DNA polymerase I-like protein with 3'-5' exonuclease and polymerase domains
MTAHHCLYPDWGNVYGAWGVKTGGYDEPGHSLAFMTSQYTRTPYYKDDGRNWRPDLGDHALWRYNCMDVIKTHEIAVKQHAELVKDDLWDCYQKYYIRSFPHALRMEWDGTPINVTLRAEVKRQREEQADTLEKEITAMVGYPLNVRSVKQKKEFLYEHRGYTERYNRKTRSISTDRETLEFFARTKQDPVLLKIIELQKIHDEISDVLSTPLDEFNYTHCHFKQGGTDGGRWSSTRSIFGSGTNLQNIPRGGVARQLFLPD